MNENDATFSGVNLVQNLGVVDPGPKSFDLSRQLFEKFRFLQAISQTNFDFPGTFPKISNCSSNFTTISIFQGKIGHLQLLQGKLFYFSSKFTTFEHTSCTS